MDFQKEIFKKIKLIDNFFKKQKIDFLICGGIAFSSLVYPRSTVDIDLIINIKEKDLEALKNSLEKSLKNLVINKKIINFGNVKVLRIVFVEEIKELIIDLIFLNEEYLKEIFKNKIVVNFYNLELPIVDPNDLFILKSLSEMERDKLDLEEIKKKYKINYNYVKKWLKKLKG